MVHSESDGPHVKGSTEKSDISNAGGTALNLMSKKRSFVSIGGSASVTSIDKTMLTYSPSNVTSPVAMITAPRSVSIVMAAASTSSAKLDVIDLTTI